MTRLVPAVLLSATFVACFAKEQLVPTPVPKRDTPQSSANGVKVWAGTLLWAGTPNDTESWVLPIAVDIENTTDKGVYFDLDEVRLADDQGNKTAPFFMPIVLNYPFNWQAMRENMRKNPPRTDTLFGDSAVFSANNARGPSSGVAAWTDETGLGTVPPISWKEEVRFVGAPRILSTRALTDRMIEPKSRTTGYLYFPRARAGAKKLTLSWKGNTVHFENVEVK